MCLYVVIVSFLLNFFCDITGWFVWFFVISEELSTIGDKKKEGLILMISILIFELEKYQEKV
jgi:hypothetical protein